MGCGVGLAVRDGRLVGLRGDHAHPTTRGMVCTESLFLAKVVSAPDRIREPRIWRDGELVAASGDEAVGLVVERIAQTIRDSGPKSVGFHGSGPCLSEKSYLANLRPREEMGKLWGCRPGTIKSEPGLHTVDMFKARAADAIKAVQIATTNAPQSAGTRAAGFARARTIPAHHAAW
jgi:anaerobic selenocysteine-containing dehydrogenase